jgi:hypothetical protein
MWCDQLGNFGVLATAIFKCKSEPKGWLFGFPLRVLNCSAWFSHLCDNQFSYIIFMHLAVHHSWFLVHYHITFVRLVFRVFKYCILGHVSHLAAIVHVIFSLMGDLSHPFMLLCSKCLPAICSLVFLPYHTLVCLHCSSCHVLLQWHKEYYYRL